ncbi:hypothetical protein DFH09DRAFT_1209251 [Mycena vulgaris]|nr:hypothetical protein DFH09DRAFT_1209251 [Mycena vulgaris]
MPDGAPPTASASHAAYAHLAREFLITVALSFCCLLALLHTVQCHVLIFFGADTPCPPCAALAALSPLAVLKTTTLCALLVFVIMEALACAARRLGWAPSTRTDDAEMGVENAERGAGEHQSYEKVEPKPRSDAVVASEQRVQVPWRH